MQDKDHRYDNLEHSAVQVNYKHQEKKEEICE